MNLSLRDQFRIMKLKEEYKVAARECDVALCYELDLEIEAIRLGLFE